MALVSVIIPVYNVEKYLSECLDSVCSQTFEDLEIICVNDGSTDSSPEILEKYAKSDDRIKIINQKNQGLSQARNTGMDNITGKYTYFIDSDDILEENAIERLYNLAEEHSLDVVIFKLINFDDETKEKSSSNYYDMAFLKEMFEDNVFSYKDISPVDFFKISVSVPSKFYKTDLISDFRFPLGLLFEDNPFFLESFIKAERIMFYDEYLYNRRVRSESITQSPNRRFTDFITISQMLIDISKKHNLYDYFKEGLYHKIIKNVFLRFTQVSDEYSKEFLVEMKEFFESKKEEWDSDESFINTDDRIKEIYYKTLEAETPKELKLYLDIFDLNVKLEETKEIKKQLNYDNKKLLHRSQELSKKLNQLANENKDLKNK